MKQRQFLKVVGTSIIGFEGSRLQTTYGRGIIALKRGQSAVDWIRSFFEGRDITTFTLHEREGGNWVTAPMMFLNEEPKRVLSYSFTQFNQDELGFYAKDLSPAELERDIKPLRKIIYG